MDNIYGQEPITPQLSELGVKPSGNPLQMRGLMHVLSNVYTEGMSLDELQLAVGTIIQQQLTDAIQTMDPATVQTVMTFLQGVDYTLTLDNNKQIRNK